MTDYTTDDVRVLSVEVVKRPKRADALKVRIALINKAGVEGDNILLETTRLIDRSLFDEADAVRVVRHWFLQLCELGAKAMEPFRIPEGQLPRIDKPKE